MSSSTIQRVPQHTPDEINEQIRLQTEQNVAYFAHAGTAAINQRLVELDEEWDIERALEANAATVSLLGMALGVTSSRKWFLLPTAVAGFLLQHAVQGWCPPLPIMRRLGFRTAAEIDRERYALKALRGDFRDLDANGSMEGPDPRATLDAVRK